MHFQMDEGPAAARSIRDTADMSRPTRASRSVEIDAPRQVVYDLVTDITRTGEWSPECRRCEWLDAPGEVGSRFKGHNRRGPARWATTAMVLAADPPTTFSFATLYRDQPATRWTYELAGDERTTLTESFDALSVPWLIAAVEAVFIRNRQEQLEAGIAETLQRIKAIAEGS